MQKKLLSICLSLLFTLSLSIGSFAFSKDVDKKYLKALLYSKEGNYDISIEILDKIIAAKPDYYKAYYMKGLIEGYNGNYDEAINNLNSTVKLKPDFTKAFVELGKMEFALNRYKDAISHFEKALKLDKSNKIANTYLAKSYFAIKDYDRGITYFEKNDSYSNKDKLNFLKSITENELTDDNPHKTFLEGYIYYKKSDYEKAINLFEKYLLLNNNSENKYKQLSEIYLSLCKVGLYYKK